MNNNYDYSSLNSSRFSSMLSSIDNAQTNRILLDNISNHYIFEDEVHMSFSILRKYENLIRSNIETVELDKKYWYKPEYFCKDYYGTTDLWYLIMFVNNMVNPMEFCIEKINVVQSEFIETFCKIIERETQMRATQKDPIFIYKHLLKDLNKDSKQVLPSDFDAAIEDMLTLIDYRDATNEYITNDNIIYKKTNIIPGKLHANIYSFDDETNIETFLEEKILTGYNHMDDCINDYGDNIKIVKDGYFLPRCNGIYIFKVFTDCDFQMYFNDKIVINHIGGQTKLNDPRTKNVLEAYSKNSDFKRRNLDYWKNYSKTSKLIYNENLNKNLLRCSLVNSNNTKNLVLSSEVIMDNKDVTFENEGDFVFDIDYYLENGKRYHKLIQEIIFVKQDNTELKFERETNLYTENGMNIKKLRMIINRPSGLLNSDIKKIKLNLYSKLNAENINSVESVILINKFKIFTVEFKEYSYRCALDKNDHNFVPDGINWDGDPPIQIKLKTILTKTSENSDFFKMIYKFNDTHSYDYYDFDYQDISDKMLFMYQGDFINKIDTTKNIGVKVYNLETDFLKDQFYYDKLSMDGTKSYYDLYDYCWGGISDDYKTKTIIYNDIAKENKKLVFEFNLTDLDYFSNKKMKLIGDSNHDIKFYYDNQLLGHKDTSKNELEFTCPNITKNSFKLVVEFYEDYIKFDTKIFINNSYEDIDNSKLSFYFKNEVDWNIKNGVFTIPKNSGNYYSIHTFMLNKLPEDNEFVWDIQFMPKANNEYDYSMMGAVRLFSNAFTNFKYKEDPFNVFNRDFIKTTLQGVQIIPASTDIPGVTKSTKCRRLRTNSNIVFSGPYETEDQFHFSFHEKYPYFVGNGHWTSNPLFADMEYHAGGNPTACYLVIPYKGMSTVPPEDYYKNYADIFNTTRIKVVSHYDYAIIYSIGNDNKLKYIDNVNFDDYIKDYNDFVVNGQYGYVYAKYLKYFKKELFNEIFWKVMHQDNLEMKMRLYVKKD